MIDKISITTRSNKKHVMSVEAFSRWLCLAEAIEFINQKATISNIDLDKDDKWIKPLSLQKYIKERHPSMTHNLRVEEFLF